MTTSFRHPVGASADVAELEFISALHQTELHPRQDASIKAIDIVHFLSSRYGIRVTVEEVEKTILHSLGGEDDEVGCIDLVEMVSILLIPELVKAYRLLFDGPTMERDPNEFDNEWEYKDYQRRFAMAKSRMPDPLMIENVLEMILNDATGSASPKRLDRQLIKDVFAAYGEDMLVEDDEIIDEMIMAATSSEENGAGTFLDTRAFARALTSDVQRYDVDNETELSTHYHDVFDTYESTKETTDWYDRINISTNETERSKKDDEWTEHEPDSNETRPVARSFTAASIDYVAGTYRSKVYVITLWVCALTTYFAYLWDFELSLGHLDCQPQYDENSEMVNRGQYFGCRIANGLINWAIIMVQLSVLGSIFICFGSIGNSVFATSAVEVLFGMASIAVFTILPFATEWRTPFFETVHSAEAQYQFIYYLSLVLGCALMLMQMKHLIRLFTPEDTLKRNRRLAWFFVPGIVVSESNIKQAASFKMSRMLKNALDIHKESNEQSISVSRLSEMAETSYGRALLSFNNSSDKFKTVGGILWAWRGIWRGSLQEEEGIFLNSHVVAGNVAQIIVCVFIFITGIVYVVVETSREPSGDPSASSFAPKRWMYILSIFVGVFFGFFAAVSIVIQYIPSTVSTILQFRSGALPSLRDPTFWIFRVCEDQITLIFGSIFWGAFYTAFACAFFFGLVAFVAVWQVTRDLFLAIFANIIGLGITVLLKVLILRVLRKSYYAAFYRKRPAAANMMGVILQSWNVALATGYMLARGLMLLLATMLFIGRIDRPFLAPESARLGPLHLDGYSVAFRKTLLVNEAHRHPYLERLGLMYMYKLRHGDNFGRTSGSVWRLLFSFALFPWLRKYRVQARPELRDEDDVDADAFKFGSYRILPKPPPRYGSIVGQASVAPEGTILGEEELNSPAAPGSVHTNEESKGEKEEEDTAGEENEALREEVESLRWRNKVLEARLRLLTEEREGNVTSTTSEGGNASC